MGTLRQPRYDRGMGIVKGTGDPEDFRRFQERLDGLCRAYAGQPVADVKVALQAAFPALDPTILDGFAAAIAAGLAVHITP